MNEILFELDKFYQTLNLESEFELAFHKQRQHVQILMFNPNFTKFEPISDLNWIKPNEKIYYSFGPHCSPVPHGLPGPCLACQAHGQAFRPAHANQHCPEHGR
jgi:hypothetical protein